MSAPLYDALLRYAAAAPARFHMPGHKGALPPPFDAVAPLDVTELADTADLYGDNQGPLRQSESMMASLYGAKDCLYLTGGATQGLCTALAALCQPGESIWVDRLCHKSVYHAMAVLDLRPAYLYREILEPFGIPGGFTSLPNTSARVCVYTDPTYHGILAAPQLPAPMLTIRDAAHGAHLPFTGHPLHPGANLTAVSAHKTLPALGQTAFLLSDGCASHAHLRERAAVFGTSSPSFPLLTSLDLAQAQLRDGGAVHWLSVADFTARLAADCPHVLSNRHTRLSLDPAKLCLHTGDGEAAAPWFARSGLVPEMHDRHNVLFMLSPGNSPEDLNRLTRAIDTLPPFSVLPPNPHLCHMPTVAATPREALFAPREQVPVHKAAGRISAAVWGPSPPGVPIAAPGERLDKIILDFYADVWYNQQKTVWVLQ